LPISSEPGVSHWGCHVSTGTGEQGEIDTRGPWNEGEDRIFTESPVLQGTDGSGAPSIVTESSPPEAVLGLDELLTDQLRDILHAEKQLTKALPKMAETAGFDQLREPFEVHLARKAKGKTMRQPT
jgi:Mn-containing catalase